MFDPDLASFRFGTGLSPRIPPPVSAEAMLAELYGPDRIAEAIPIRRFEIAPPTLMRLRELNRARRDARGTDSAEAAEAEFRAYELEVRQDFFTDVMRQIARGATTADPLRERLVAFWADHFTVRAKNSFTRHLVGHFIESAIRPYLTRPFSEMLRAAATHPLMLDYLDQSRSFGPGSELGQRTGRGLNENLAREVMELHTLGVGGPYTQADVCELAELLTGLFWQPGRGTIFRPLAAEPGAEEVLGTAYEGRGRAPIDAALDDLARHPATGAHLARKLTTHFIGPDADPELVALLARRFAETGGDLGVMTTTLLTHPAAWVPERRQVRRPVEFVTAAFRALGVSAADLTGQPGREVQRWILRPLAVMGQPWEAPPGPDGWAEAPEDWITPQGLAGRIDWAMRAPATLLGALPDPRDFVVTALGGFVTPDVRFAAEAAESVDDGIGLVLASAAFQRR